MKNFIVWTRSVFVDSTTDEPTNGTWKEKLQLSPGKKVERVFGLIAVARFSYLCLLQQSEQRNERKKERFRLPPSLRSLFLQVYTLGSFKRTRL